MKKEIDEDKALLQIRIETLKTMIGKMKESQYEIKASLSGNQTRKPSPYVLNPSPITRKPSPRKPSLSPKLINSSTFKTTNFKKNYFENFPFKYTNNAYFNKNKPDRFKWAKQSCDKQNDINRNTSNNSSFAKFNLPVANRNKSSVPVANRNKSSVPVANRNNIKFYSEKDYIKNKNSKSTSDSLPPISRRLSLKSSTENSKPSDEIKIQIQKVCDADMKKCNEPNSVEKVIPPKVVWVRTTAKKSVESLYSNYQSHLPMSKLYKKPSIFQTENQIMKQSHHLLSKYKFLKNKQYVPSVNSCMNGGMLRRNNKKKFVWRRRSLEIEEKGIIKHGRNTFIVKRFQAVQRGRDATYRLNSSQLNKNNNIRSKSKEIILTRHGYNFKLASNLKSLKRVNLTNAGDSHPGGHLNGKLMSSSHKRLAIQKTSKLYLASCVLKKTINRVQCQKKKRNYCLFYSRFGKCKRGETCNYIHDPEKVAVCTRFLRGTCKDENCIFSHKFDPNKMPVCSYFLLGQCTRDICPYRHVNVSISAPICEAFVKGFCPHGEKCTKKHTLECEEFLHSGICSNKKSCRLVHRIKIKRGRTVSASGLRRPRAFIKNKSNERLGGVLSPLKDSGRAHLLPSFLNLKSDLVGSTNKGSSLRSMLAANATSDFSNSYTDDATISINTVDNQPAVEISKKDHIEFIPLKCSFSDESDNESGDEPRYTRQFSFKEQDFISLE